jgi:2-phosphosulfolactate phosphatase
MEDTLFGGALAARLIGKGYVPASDAVQVALSMWKEARPDVRGYIGRTEHIKRLIANNLQDSADYCLSEDTANLIPVYNKNTKRITLA